jgi:(p)ppGpp synthase/HD superfamily hydrolase
VTAWLPGCGAIEVAIATRDMEGENIWGVVYALKHGKDISHYRPIEILTPTGGARFLPENSTVLDAVASIQQEFLLDKISAVVVNGKLAGISEPVNPGDVVEVITEGTRLEPSEEWLKYSNISTARLLQTVLAIDGLKKAAENGQNLIKPILASRGILTLEDVEVLEPDKMDNLLEKLACASLEDLYAAVGSGAVRLQDLNQSLDSTGISQESLQWTSINIVGEIQAHKPGVLAKLALLVSQEGGNILRSVNNTSPNGGFGLRLVVHGLNENTRASLRQAYKSCGIPLKTIELV